MSATMKSKKVSFENVRLVQKSDGNKRERIHTNQNLRNIARNPNLAMDEEEIDDTPFFEFDSEGDEYAE